MEKDEDQDAKLNLPSGHRRKPVRNCVRKVKATTTSSLTGGEDCGRKVKDVLSESPSSDFTIHKKSRKRKKFILKMILTIVRSKMKMSFLSITGRFQVTVVLLTSYLSLWKN